MQSNITNSHELALLPLNPPSENKNIDCPFTENPLIQLIKELSKAIEPRHPKFAADLLDLLNKNLENNTALKPQLITKLHDIIHGSPRQALAVNTFAFFTGYGAAVAMSPVINSMTELKIALKYLLLTLSPLGATAVQALISALIDKNGVIKPVVLIRIISLIGASGLIALSAMTNIKTIDHADARYLALLICNLLIGFSIATYPLIINILHWSKKENAGFIQSMYTGLGGSVLGLSLLSLQFLLDQTGLPSTLGLFSALSFIGLLATAKFYHPSPYHQLIQLKLSPELARQVAEILGQENFPTPVDRNYWKSIAQLLIQDSRAIGFGTQVYATFGGFILAATSSYIALTTFGLSTQTAVLITAAGSLWTTMTRVLTGKPIDKYDPSGGTLSFLFSGTLIITGALMLAIPRPTLNLPYALAAKFIADTGFALGINATFKQVAAWSTPPENKPYLSYNLGGMNTLVSLLGATSAVTLPLVMALFTLADSNSGYLNSFYLTAGLAITASALSAWNHHHSHAYTPSFISRIGQATASLSETIHVPSWLQETTQTIPSLLPHLPRWR